jgi:hypothetical protein
MTPLITIVVGSKKVHSSTNSALRPFALRCQSRGASREKAFFCRHVERHVGLAGWLGISMQYDAS